ncbi:MAG: hypothetical protein AAGG01_06240 [Planctomycetota bacterium]
MTSLRISIVCLAGAALAGGLGLIPGDLWLAPPAQVQWLLRLVCLGGLIGFAISFMVGLDRRSLVKS